MARLMTSRNVISLSPFVIASHGVAVAVLELEGRPIYVWQMQSLLAGDGAWHECWASSHGQARRLLGY